MKKDDIYVSSLNIKIEFSVGFEPTTILQSLDYESSAINHYAKKTF